MMVERYRQFRMPLEAYMKLKEKRNKMEAKLYSLSGKRVKVPMTKLMNMLANQTLYVDDEPLMRMFSQGKRRRDNGFQ